MKLYAYTILGIGYDAGGTDRTTCGRPYRAGRLYQPPCDLTRMGYCSQAGQLYPWRAVKRFVKDNQGLMRRMYGDQRHGHVLRVELEDGDQFEEEWEKDEKKRGGYGRWRPEPIRFARYQHQDEMDNDLEEDLDLDFRNPYAGESRYLRGDLTNEDVFNTKFVISEQEAAIAIKLAKLKAAAHFRPATRRSTITTRNTPLSTSRTPETTTTQKSSSSISRTTTIEYKNRPSLTKTSYGSNEATTGKFGTTAKGTTRTTLMDISTEESTLATTSSATTDDLVDHSTIDTTTDRTTERLINTTLTTTKKPFITEKVSTQFTEHATTVKSMTGKITASDRLGEAPDNDDSITIEATDQNTDRNRFPSHKNNTYESADNLQNSDQISDDSFDQTVESSEYSQVYSDSDGNVKQVGTGNTPAVLFQDMAEEPSKKKMPLNFDKMKGVNACPVKEEVVAPFWANNTRGEVLALLNMYPFEQYVHWEKCTFEHRQMYCREGCRCEQQYRLHRLLAYDPNNECRGIFSDWFRFPSCCVCICYDMPPEFRVTSRSPRFQVPFPENKEDYEL